MPVNVLKSTAPDVGMVTASTASAGGECNAGNTTLAAFGQNGTYTGLTFAREAVRIVHEHADNVAYSNTPLFMYLALHDTHAPLEAPWEYVSPFVDAFPGDTKRQIFSGMVSFVDDTVRNLTDALQETGMWNNTLFVWTNDNVSFVACVREGIYVYIGIQFSTPSLS